jgi:uncharacterized protein (TIGR00730 family)
MVPLRVCVFTGSSSGIRAEYAAAARDLGQLLAHRGIDLVYGGACVGLMGVVADAALEAGGRAIGVIPSVLVAKEVAHDGLTELHVVSSMHERKAKMADLSDAFIGLPGGLGTWEELFEVLTWGQLGLHRKPCGLLNTLHYFDPLLAFVRHSVDEGFVRREHAGMITVADESEELLARLESYEPPVVGKWIDRTST